MCSDCKRIKVAVLAMLAKYAPEPAAREAADIAHDYLSTSLSSGKQPPDEMFEEMRQDMISSLMSKSFTPRDIEEGLGFLRGVHQLSDALADDLQTVLVERYERGDRFSDHINEMVEEILRQRRAAEDGSDSLIEALLARFDGRVHVINLDSRSHRRQREEKPIS